MTSVFLLPVVTGIVASSTGGVLAQALYPISPFHSLVTISLCIFLVSIGLCMAFMILTVYYFRLIIYGIPKGPDVLSSFMPLGPMGQAGFAINLIGDSLRNLLPYTASSSALLRSELAGETIYAVCVCISFCLWCWATMWLIFALLGIFEVVRKTQIPFRISFWGLIFPNVSHHSLGS
jgi:tellurite resistance protein TehA-like permease